MDKNTEKDIQENMPIDPRMMQAMYDTMPEEDEIDLLEYWNVLWKKRLLIVSVSFFAAVIAAGVSLMIPNIYRAEALLAPVGGEERKGGLSSVLGGLGGIASLAGVSLGGGGSVEQNIAVLKSRDFIWGFVKDEKLMPILFEDAWDTENKRWLAEDVEQQPTLWAAWRRLIKGEVLSVSVDKDSGLVRLGIEWEAPELAAEWAAKIVTRINAYSRKEAIEQSKKKLEYLNSELKKTRIEENKQALYSLISSEQKQAMLANTQQDFVFRVIDPAVAPDKKIKPKRAIIVIVTAFVVGFLVIISVFIQEGLHKRKEEGGTDER